MSRPVDRGAPGAPALRGRPPSRPRLARRAGRLYLAVGCGAALGSLMRFAIGHAAAALGAPGYAATLVVNLAGSALIGFIAAIAGPDGRLLLSPALRHFLMTGVCGGLTTFSALSLDTLTLFSGHGVLASAAYLAASVLLSLAAAWAGFAAATRLNR
jgi:CrcB protein